ELGLANFECPLAGAQRARAVVLALQKGGVVFERGGVGGVAWRRLRPDAFGRREFARGILGTALLDAQQRQVVVQNGVHARRGTAEPALGQRAFEDGRGLLPALLPAQQIRQPVGGRAPNAWQQRQPRDAVRSPVSRFRRARTPRGEGALGPLRPAVAPNRPRQQGQQQDEFCIHECRLRGHPAYPCKIFFPSALAMSSTASSAVRLRSSSTGLTSTTSSDTSPLLSLINSSAKCASR